MLSKRLIVCLDVRDRKVTKGVRFEGNVEVGDPVEMTAQYYNDGADELVFYDITTSAEVGPLTSSWSPTWPKPSSYHLGGRWHPRCRRHAPSSPGGGVEGLRQHLGRPESCNHPPFLARVAFTMARIPIRRDFGRDNPTSSKSWQGQAVP